MKICDQFIIINNILLAMMRSMIDLEAARCFVVVGVQIKTE
jgi:hypothetical protein